MVKEKDTTYALMDDDHAVVRYHVHADFRRADEIATNGIFFPEMVWKNNYDSKPAANDNVEYINPKSI